MNVKARVLVLGLLAVVSAVGGILLLVREVATEEVGPVRESVVGRQHASPLAGDVASPIGRCQGSCRLELRVHGVLRTRWALGALETASKAAA